MPAYTHDRYGRPLAPQIAHVLNDMAIPLPKRRASGKKQSRSVSPFPASALMVEKSQNQCGSFGKHADGPTGRRRRVSCPHLEECASHPLGDVSMSDEPSGTDLGDAPELEASDMTLSPQTSAESASSAESATSFLKRALSSVTRESERAGELARQANKEPNQREPKPKHETTLLKVSKWLNFFSGSPPRGRGGITLPPPAPPISPPQGIADELAGADPELEPAVMPLVTYGVHETPVVHVRPRLARSNPRFLRTLALENAMCEKGKITYPSAQMFLPPRDHRSHECDVLGICTRIDNHRTRQWAELDEEDFDDADVVDDDADAEFEASFDQSLALDTYTPARPDMQPVVA